MNHCNQSQKLMHLNYHNNVVITKALFHQHQILIKSFSKSVIDSIFNPSLNITKLK